MQLEVYMFIHFFFFLYSLKLLDSQSLEPQKPTLPVKRMRIWQQTFYSIKGLRMMTKPMTVDGFLFGQQHIRIKLFEMTWNDLPCTPCNPSGRLLKIIILIQLL